MEIWRDIHGYEGKYQVSNYGRIKSLYTNKLKKATIKNTGYKCVDLYLNGKRENKTIHRLVAMAFIPNPNSYKVINHIDGNKLNNNVNNLEWCTQSYNIKHSYDNNLHIPTIEKAINSRKRKILCHQNNKKYNSIIEAAKDLNLNTGKICEVCKGTRNHTKGYTFEYIKED